MFAGGWVVWRWTEGCGRRGGVVVGVDGGGGRSGGVVVDVGGGRREEVRWVAFKNKNPTLRMWGKIHIL